MDPNEESISPEQIEITGIFRLNIIKRHLSQSNAQALGNSLNDTKRPITSKSFKYTNASAGAMTNEQRDEYERNGFVVVRKLINDECLDKYKKRFQTICSDKIKVPGMTVTILFNYFYFYKSFLKERIKKKVMKDITIAKSEFLEGEKAITKIQDFTNDDELFE